MSILIDLSIFLCYNMYVEMEKDNMLEYTKEYESLDKNRNKQTVETCKRLLQAFNNENKIQFLYDVHFLHEDLRVDIYYNLSYSELREIEPITLEKLKNNPIQNIHTDKRWVTLHTLKDLIQELNSIDSI